MNSININTVYYLLQNVSMFNWIINISITNLNVTIFKEYEKIEILKIRHSVVLN